MEIKEIVRGNARKRGANIHQFNLLADKLKDLEARVQKLEREKKIKTGGKDNA